MNSPLRILHVIAALSPDFGGPSKACLEMASCVAHRGHQVTIFTTNIASYGEMQVSLKKPIMEKGVSIRYFPIQPPRFWRFSLPMARALKNRTTEFDIAHLHSLYLFQNLITGPFCRANKIPYIMRPHGTLDSFLWQRHRFRKGLVDYLFGNRNISHAAAIHFTTEEEDDLAIPKIFGTRSVVIPNDLNFSDYSALPPKGTFKKRFPQLIDKRMLLFLSRLNFKQGLDLLIPAFGPVVKTFSDAHLMLAGPMDVDMQPRIQAWAKENHVEERLIFTGMQSGAEKLAAFVDAEMFILPSYSENFGIAGKPC